MKRFILFLPFFPVAAWADDSSVYNSSVIVVTATRIPQPLVQTIEDATVITQQDIRASGAPDVLSVLRNLAGVEITQSGGVGSQSSIFMRGTNSNHVLILLDGVRIGSVTTGTTEVDQLMLDQIDHIEVVRGNASSLYGSSAIGGVIQIFTKKGHGAPSFNFSSGYGSLNTRKTTLGFGGVLGSNQFSVQASQYSTNGIPANNPVLAPAVNPAADGYNNASFSTNLSHRFNSDHRLAFSVFGSRGNNYFNDAYAVSPTDVYNSISEIQKLSLVEDDKFTEFWKSRLQLADGKDNYQAFLNGSQNNQLQTENQQLDWQNTFKLSPEGEVLLGAEHLNQSVSATTAFTRTKRIVNSLYAGYTGNYARHQIQVNLRQDRYSDFGLANTGLLGYGFRFTDALRATASYSTAFKAPTFNDLFYPLFYGYQGNPNLQPERSRNVEAGLHYDRSDQQVDLIYFDNRIGNLIAINAAGTTMVNIGQAHISGEELSYSGQFGTIGVKVSLTSQNPLDAQTGQTLLRRSRFFSSLAVTQQLGKLQLGGDWHHSGSRNDQNFISFPATPVTLQSYDLVNLTANYALTKQWHINARVANLFNRNYMLVYPYNTLGRTIFTSISYQP